MPATQAAAAGAAFVDLRDATVGHDMCASPSERFYEPLVPATGGVADLVLDAVPGGDQSRGSSR
jgi:hypothetical protein